MVLEAVVEVVNVEEGLEVPPLEDHNSGYLLQVWNILKLPFRAAKQMYQLYCCLNCLTVPNGFVIFT